jgi:hypothetical protein
MSQPRTSIPAVWLREVLSYLRSLDFFTGSQDPTDIAALTSSVREQAENSWLFPAGLLNPDDKRLGWTADQLIATFDRNRVWFTDAEVDNEERDYWYVRTLLDWARISRGHFRPQNLSEIWRSPNVKGDVAIEVRFTHDDAPFLARLSRQGGWFDYDLISVVNGAIRESGHQFASVACQSDQCVFLCCLTEAERTKLHQEKSWRFHADRRLA